MSPSEERELIAGLRRRGDYFVRAGEISCRLEEYRAGARRVGRQHGWRIRTAVPSDRSGVWVVWTDRGHTELETRAALVAISSGRHFDEVLEELRRQNLRPIDAP